MKNYTTKETAEIIGVSIRTIQRQLATILNNLSNTHNKGVVIDEGMLNLLKWRCNNDTIATSDDNENEEEFDYLEGFTTAEYVEFQKRINEYPVLKEYIENLKKDLEFLRFNFAQQMETNKSLVQTLRENNFIEAKEKGFDQEL